MPSGMPDAIPFAMQTISGCTPVCSIAHHLPVRPAPTLDFVSHQQNAVLVADAAQLLHEDRGRYHVAALALHRLDKDCRHFFRRQSRLEQLVLDEARTAERERLGILRSAFAAAIDVGIAHVSYARHARAEAPLLLRLGGGQRERAHGASVERAEKCDDVLPLGVIAGQFQRGFHRLRPRIAVVNLVRTRHGRDLRQPLGQRNHALVVKIRSRHVDQFARLLLNGGDHVGMAMPGRSNGDAGGEVEEFVAVHVRDHDAAAALGYQRVGACIRRRNVFLIARENALGIGAGQGGLDFGACKSLTSQRRGSHGILRKAVVSLRSSIVSQRAVAPKKADSAPKPHHLGGWETSRYRTNWDAPAKATLPDDGVGRPESRASTRAGANWASDGASGNIPSSL